MKQISFVTILTAVIWISGCRPCPAEPMPDRFGQVIHLVYYVYEEMSEITELGEEWQILIVPDTMHKACIRGGNIYISYKFILKLRSADELACVIGHEIAHVKLGHILCGKTCTDKDEAEADYWGWRYAKAAGYDPDVCALLERFNFPQRRIDYLQLAMEATDGILR